MSETTALSTRVEKSFFGKLKQDSKIISNINFILDKMDRDGHLTTIKSSIESIFNKEIIFAVTELSKIQKKARNFDMKTQLTTNSFIFKENLKVITGFVSKLISRADMER